MRANKTSKTVRNEHLWGLFTLTSVPKHRLTVRLRNSPNLYMDYLHNAIYNIYYVWYAVYCLFASQKVIRTWMPSWKRVKNTQLLDWHVYRNKHRTLRKPAAAVLVCDRSFSCSRFFFMTSQQTTAHLCRKMRFSALFRTA